MEGIAQADIFFFITGIAVILFGSALVTLVVYLIMISRDVRYIVGLARREASALAEDVAQVRNVIKEKGEGLGAIASFLRKAYKKKTRKVGEKKEKE